MNACPLAPWVALGSLVLGAAAPTRAAEVQELEVTSAPIFDFEFDFDHSAGRFAWISDANELWVGHVDPATGAFSPLTGKAELVDAGAVVPGNGAEWAATTTGNRIVYNKHPSSSWFMKIGEARFDGTQWQKKLVPFTTRHIMPLGNSETVGSLAPILSLVLVGLPSEPQLACHVLDFPGVPQMVPQSQGATGGRWVPGKFELTFSAPIGGGRQAFHYDGFAQATEQLTFDNTHKQTVFMWEAPEFGGEEVFFASAKANELSQIRVYRSLDPDQDGEFDWTVVKTLNPPTPGIYFWSPEPFVHNGKSYIYWVASENPDQPDPAFPSQIWIAAADPADPFYESLSDNTLSRFRLDPELYVTDEGPCLYYNRFIPGTPQQYEGIYRVDTGLGPVQP
jgi:hypothetical protein